MTDRPLIVLSFDGLATAALGCYGSSWNDTPAIDAIAGTGSVWDRCIATSDDPHLVLRDSADAQSVAWTTAWRSRGPIELLTDVTSARRGMPDACFDRIEAVAQTDPDESDLPVSDMVHSQMGKLIAAAIDRDAQDESWGALWLHSDFLTRRWDAPRDLFPIDDIDDQQLLGPTEDPQLVETGLPLRRDFQPLPPIFDTVIPPAMKVDDQAHPDLVTSWMRTYGCQVRMLDLLIEVLLTSLRQQNPYVVLLGTSGFRLGQGGWIGHRRGPLRSPDIHLPLIVSDSGPLRIGQLTASNVAPQLLYDLGISDGKLFDASRWSHADDRSQVETRSERAEYALTTPKWFFVRDDDSSEHLFLKPDDVADFNDVGRLRSDVIEQLNRQK